MDNQSIRFKEQTIHIPSTCCCQEKYSGVGDPGAFEFNDGSNYPDSSEGIGRLHSKKGGSIMALAGHVLFITRKQFSDDSNTPNGRGPGPGGKTYLWWSPYSKDGH